MTKLTARPVTVKIIKWLPLLVVCSSALIGCENRPNEPIEPEQTPVTTDINEHQDNTEKTDSATIEELPAALDRPKVKVDAQLADAVESLAKQHPAKDSDVASSP